MPDLSGEGFFGWLRKNRPAMASKVTVISGDLANPQTVEILERIGQPYLLKPFKTAELLKHIEDLASA
jgi:DNA-binding response OmpR family regulator